MVKWIKVKYKTQIREKCCVNPCSCCGSTDFVLVTELISNRIREYTEDYNSPYFTLNVSTICQNCGHVNLFDINYLGLAEEFKEIIYNKNYINFSED